MVEQEGEKHKRAVDREIATQTFPTLPPTVAIGITYLVRRVIYYSGHLINLINVFHFNLSSFLHFSFYLSTIIYFEPNITYIYIYIINR